MFTKIFSLHDVIYYSRSAINIQSCETNAIETLQNIKQFSLFMHLFFFWKGGLFFFMYWRSKPRQHMLDKHSIIEISLQLESAYL